MAAEDSLSRWLRVKEIVADALEVVPERREAFLDDACGGDDRLRSEVGSLLEASEGPDTLESPIASKQVESLLENVLPAPPDRERIGPWRLVEEIGRGGMGVVYLAERVDGDFEQQVALKLIKRGMDSDAIVARFRNERQVLASLQHPHIARLYDGGVTEDGRPWFAMEYIQGLPITDYCDGHNLSFEERLKLFAKVCRAVEHAHNRLIIHRDLKPSNILVTENGEPCILDFGLAKVLEDPMGDPATTRPGHRWMTLDCASPEQVRGDVVGTPSDSYQLGLILYEMLTGRRPYTVKGLSPTEAERVICEVNPPKPSTSVASHDRESASPQPTKLRKRLRGDVDTIILKALHKDPDRGYASAQKLADDVERYLRGLPIHARPETTAYRARKFLQRHRWGVAAAGLVLFTLLAGLAGTLWQAQRATESARRAAEERDRAEEVIAFLTNLFESNDPTRVQTDSLTARALIQQGLDHAEAVGGQPELQASLFSVIGKIYLNLGDNEKAEALFRRALSAWETAEERQISRDERDMTRLRLGNALYRQGRREEAEPFIRRVVAERTDTRLGDPIRRDALFSLFEVLHRLGQTESADEVFAAWEEANEHAPPPSSVDDFERMIGMAEVLGNRGQIRGDADAIRRGLALSDQAVSALRVALGNEHPTVLTALLRHTKLFGQERDLIGAAPERLALEDSLSREALELARTIYPEPHVDLQYALRNRAMTLRKLKQLDEAETLMRETMDVTESVYGGDGLAWIRALNDLAVIRLDKGEHDRAVEQLTEVKKWFVTRYGSDYLFTLTKVMSLGTALVVAGRYEEAERELLAAYETLHADRGTTDRYTKDALQKLVELYSEWGKTDEARRYRERLKTSDSESSTEGT